MLRTPLCDLLGIEVPIICAPFGPWEQVDLAAAVSNAGALGSLGTALRTVTELRSQWARLRDLTDRPFAINHTLRPLDMEAFEATLRERPAAISFHIGDPGDLVRRAHDAGILWIQQVFDLDQARRAVDRGADVVIAQGGEAGGNGGFIGTMVMVPAVVDLAGTVPVVASGGIADGRGIAAALTLGAQGVNLGTRFLATTEMRISDRWKQFDPRGRAAGRGEGRLRRCGAASAVARRSTGRTPGIAHRVHRPVERRPVGGARRRRTGSAPMCVPPRPRTGWRS